MTDAIESTLADKRPRHPSTFHTGTDPRHNNKAHAALHKTLLHYLDTMSMLYAVNRDAAVSL